MVRKVWEISSWCSGTGRIWTWLVKHCMQPLTPNSHCRISLLGLAVTERTTSLFPTGIRLLVPDLSPPLIPHLSCLISPRRHWPNTPLPRRLRAHGPSQIMFIKRNSESSLPPRAIMSATWGLLRESVIHTETKGPVTQLTVVQNDAPNQRLLAAWLCPNLASRWVSFDLYDVEMFLS